LRLLVATKKTEEFADLKGKIELAPGYDYKSLRADQQLIVVDSSVLIDLLQGWETPATDRLQDLENDRIPVSIPVVCFQEVLQGAKDEREWSLLSEYLESQDLLLPADSLSTHREAARSTTIAGVRALRFVALRIAP